MQYRLALRAIERFCGLFAPKQPKHNKRLLCESFVFILTQMGTTGKKERRLMHDFHCTNPNEKIHRHEPTFAVRACVFLL
jgi:hypothetical protein